MFTPDLPKTRSGKIMRRLLRDIAEGRAARRHDDAGRRRRGRDDPARSPARRRTDVPFDFLSARRSSRPRPRRAGPGHRGRPRVRRASAFDGLTEEWRLMGACTSTAASRTRSTGASPSPIADVSWAPVDGSGRSRRRPGLQGDRPVRPDRRPRRRDDPAAADGGREGRPPDPQGPLRPAPSRRRRSRSSGRSTCIPGRSRTRLLDRGDARCSSRSWTRARTSATASSRAARRA